MASHSGPELKLLPTVRSFCADRFPDGVVIFHPAVFFYDEIFACPDKSKETYEFFRSELGTSRKTKTVCEIIPDYAVFRKSDVLGALLRAGESSGRDLHFDPTSSHFLDLISHSDPIPYMGYESKTPCVPKDKRLVVVLKDGAKPLAILDHKGGSTFNALGQRRKVFAQARRFDCQVASMVVEKPRPCDVVRGTSITAEHIAGFQDADVYELRETAKDAHGAQKQGQVY